MSALKKICLFFLLNLIFFFGFTLQQVNAQSEGGCFTPSNNDCRIDTAICINEGRDYGIAGTNYSCNQTNGQCCLGVSWSSSSNSSLGNFQKKIEEEYESKTVGLEGFVTGQDIFYEDGASGVLSNMLYGITSLLIDKAPNQKTSYKSNGAIAVAGNLVASLYIKPPASGIEYLANIGQQFGITNVYAQGVGFSKLSPLLNLWKAFRDITYLLFVIIFIVIGFTIMFRVKISPQVVLTLESVLPKVVIALILVTFSYAISGLLIDLIYVFITFLIAVLGKAGLIKDEVIIRQYYLYGGFANVVGALFGGTLRGFDDIARLLLPSFELGATGAVAGAIIGGFLGNVPGAIVGAVGGFFGAGGLATLVVCLVLLITVLYLLLQIFFMLLMAYVSIILGILFSPFQIALSIFPGQNGFGGWVKKMLSNILVFPAVVLMMLIGTILTSSNPENLWIPPMMGWGSISNAIGGLIGLGILFMTPRAINYVKVIFNPKEEVPPLIKSIKGDIVTGTQIPRAAFESGLATVEEFTTAKADFDLERSTWVANKLAHLMRKGMKKIK